MLKKKNLKIATREAMRSCMSEAEIQFTVLSDKNTTPSSSTKMLEPEKMKRIRRKFCGSVLHISPLLMWSLHVSIHLPNLCRSCANILHRQTVGFWRARYENSDYWLLLRGSKKRKAKDRWKVCCKNGHRKSPCGGQKEKKRKQPLDSDEETDTEIKDRSSGIESDDDWKPLSVI